MQNVLDLKRIREATVPEQIGGFDASVKRIPRFSSARIFLVSGSVLVLLAGVLIAGPIISRASRAVFYPGVCGGDWKNPGQAAGEPSVLGSDAEDFTIENAAYSSVSGESISCSGFDGSVPEGALASAFTLSLSWTIVSPEATASGTDEVAVTEGDTVSEDEGADTVVVEEIEEATPLSEAESSTEDAVASEPAAASEESADDIAPTEETLPAEEPSDAQDVSVSDAVETAAPEASESQEESTISSLLYSIAYADTITATPAITDETVASVEYTTDGSEWHLLGAVRATDWRGASFELPMMAWADIKTLAVKVTVHASDTVIYLDGIELAVAHEKKAPPLLVDRTDGEADLAIFDALKGFFLLPLSANEVPIGMPPTITPTIALADTLILASDSKEPRGLVIYDVADGMLLVNTYVGAGNESAHSADYFGEGSFAMITTIAPDQCATLALLACRQHPGYLDEKTFSITTDGIAEVVDVVTAPNETNTVQIDIIPTVQEEQTVEENIESEIGTATETTEIEELALDDTVTPDTAILDAVEEVIVEISDEEATGTDSEDVLSEVSEPVPPSEPSDTQA